LIDKPELRLNFSQGIKQQQSRKKKREEQDRRQATKITLKTNNKARSKTTNNFTIIATAISYSEALLYP